RMTNKNTVDILGPGILNKAPISIEETCTSRVETPRIEERGPGRIPHLLLDQIWHTRQTAGKPLCTRRLGLRFVVDSIPDEHPKNPQGGERELLGIIGHDIWKIRKRR